MQRAGFDRFRIVIDPDGKITVVATSDVDEPDNPCDRLLRE
jgi:hypothetical protein